MDPDAGSPDVPLCAIKITTFTGGGGGGTAIGLLLQHAVGDADTQMCFMRNWARAYAGQPPETPPVHDRMLICRLAPAGDGPIDDPPCEAHLEVIEPGAPPAPPPFAGVMSRISGPCSCIVPLPKALLAAWKATAIDALPAGAFVSTDDVATAAVWQALCAMRCAQLDLPTTATDAADGGGDALSTCCSRAVNVRARTEPPLGAGYCANGVSQVWTSMPVTELLVASRAHVALTLRRDLQAFTPAAVASRAQWLAKHQHGGARTAMRFDAQALTFVVSSWGFDWEGATFGAPSAPPVAYDHGALVPLVAVFVPRPRGDGLSVYASGPQASLEQFARLLRPE